jgi:hypothetical protein
MQQTRKVTRIKYNAALDYILDLLGVGVRLVICLIAIYMGYVIAAKTTNEGIAILTALGCWGVINSLLGKKRS